MFAFFHSTLVDRHQELDDLDDILSDMLLTVQDIPDIGKTASNSQQLRKSATGAAAAAPTATSTASNSTKNQRSQLHLHIPQQSQQPQPQQQPLYGSTNSVKRSHSSVSQDESNCSTISRSTVHTTGHTRDRACGDFYDTASTATTLTPTPSESGRITPYQHQQQQPIYTRATPTNSKLTQQAIEQRERELIMDLQNQSFDYSQPLRTGSSASAASQNHSHNSKVNKVGTLSATSEDDESIPYHAREDSRPFTYGDATGVQLSPTSARKQGMIKLQAGLSSPSLVRKHLGANSNASAPTSARKSPNSGRNDFEEMLLQRREKILNDKYSIGDKTPNGNSVSHTVNANTKWINNNHSNSSNTLNGYQYHEPLKRSNTMDGGFGRGNTSGYVSDG